MLTAVTNHHDALRLQVVDRAGTWEQHIAAPQEFERLVRRVRFPTTWVPNRRRSGPRCWTSCPRPRRRMT